MIEEMSEIKHPQLSLLIKPASSSCNLKCKYCFYVNEAISRKTFSNGIMTEDMMDILVKRIHEYLIETGTLNISFQGGEPTIAGLTWFENLFTKLEQSSKLQIHYSIQTNGTMLDDQWFSFLAKHRVLVGISLDGYQQNMDLFRFDTNHQSVYFKVLRACDLLHKNKIDFNILTVITRQLSKHGKSLYAFYKEHHFDYVQLIPCLPGLDGRDDGISLRPNEYLMFYRDFFAAWMKEIRKSGYVMNVNLFENIMGLLQGYPPYQCGMTGHCTNQMVIESNGNVYPCDFYCLDEYCIGNLANDSFSDLFHSKAASVFINDACFIKKPCASCMYQPVCHGGCRRQNVCYLDDDQCTYQQLLDEIIPECMHMMR